MAQTLETASSNRDFTRARVCRVFAWGSAAVVSALAIVAWGRDYGWQLGSLSTYQIFPVLGLVAYSLMWTHYMVAALRGLLGVERQVIARYFQVTGYIVLVCICLHPGLLIYQRFRDGFGLPPHSYESYVRHGLGWVTLLGTVSLLVFLAYELRRFYGQRPWWHYVAEAGDVAMLLIFYHSLRLGTQLTHGGWFHLVWWFYGVSLTLVLIRKYARRLTKTNSPA